MGLDQAIADLLYRYDCVIVPELGGFITRRVSAKREDDRFHPPHKGISFNETLQSQDGLLTEYLAGQEGISFEAAARHIQDQVKDWKKTLSDNRYVRLKEIGKLSLSAEQSLQFQPIQTVNYCTESFGLSPVYAERLSPKQQAAVRRWHSPLKYAAVWLLLAALCASPIYQRSKQPAAAQRDQATLNPFATVSMAPKDPQSTAKARAHTQLHSTVKARQIPQEQAATNRAQQPVRKQPDQDAQALPHQLIAGAFSVRAHAERLLAELKQQGYKAQITGKTGRLTLVAVASFASKPAAMDAYYEIRKRLPKIWYRYQR